MKNLSKRGKLIFTISVVLAAVVLATLIIQIAIGLKSGNTGLSGFLNLIIIAVLAVGSCFYVYYKYARRAGYLKKLNNDYYELYENIVFTLKNSTLNNIERKEAANDILAILIREQESGKSSKEAISMEPSEYARRVCESYGKRNKTIFNILYGVQFAIFVLSIIQIVIFLVRESLESFFSPSISISLVIYVLILSFALLPLIRSFNLNKKPVLLIITIVLILAAYIGTHELMHSNIENTQWIRSYLEAEIAFISSYFMALLWAAVMTATMLIKVYLRKKSIESL